MTPSTLLDTTVSDVLASEPGAARAFIARGMACVGCPFARFETLGEVARTYGIDAHDLADAIAQARRGLPSPEEQP